MSKPEVAINFLLNTWGKQCRTGDYVFLCSRDPNNPRSWKDHPIRYDSTIKKRIQKLLKQFPADHYDLYFCPLPFSEPKRKKELVKRTKLLWQDLDYANPQYFDKELMPTTYWESSPGRFHGLWELEKTYRKSGLPDIETLNHDLAYHVGADRGGWDFTQVLRIPGTRNHKYEEKPLITYKRKDGDPVPYKKLRSIVKRYEKKELQSVEPLQEGDVDQILAKWGAKLPRTILQMLMQDYAPVGERSDTIWYLENKLYEIGLTPEEIFTLIKNSAWNKYKGRHDENERLQRELEKIIADAGNPEKMEQMKRYDGVDLEGDGVTLRVDSYREVMGNISSLPGWLVEGFWARRSHGIVAGEPKSFKSTYVMDLAISVASGEPFLGKYPVIESGPVIYVQNENADWILKDRMQKMIVHRKLDGRMRRTGEKTFEIQFPKDLPLYFINQQGYLLNHPLHQKMMEQLIEEVKPILVIFDPLYLMFDGDVNSAKDLNPVLNWMLKIKNDYRTGVIAIHHYNKGAGGKHWRGGQRMLGSTTLHGWIESAWYLNREEPEEDEGDVAVEKQSTNPSKVILDREFRNAGQFPKLELSLFMGELGNPVYKVEAEVYKEENDSARRGKTTEELAAEIKEIIDNSSFDIVSFKTLREVTGAKKSDVVDALDLVIQSGEGKYKRIETGVKKIQ